MTFSRKLSLRNVGFIGGLGGFKAIGGSISIATIGGVDYQVHTFQTSGTFEVLSGEETVDYLIIAAGGSGGPADNSPRGGGGGGAGGLIQGSTLVQKNTYTVNVAPATVTTTLGQTYNGANSSVFSQTAVGGGYGARGNVGTPPPGGNGGSGGGGARGSSGGSGIPGQGNNGGTVPGTDVSGGGGGGFSSAASGGTRGSGVFLNFDGNGRTFCQGGQGGSANGAGPGANAPNNLGFGGEGGKGGSGSEQLGGNGGSGLVIIRFPI